ncbi:MAG TPA: cytochrome c3 family protein [Thermoanaerobaculia bacterium]
MSMRSLAIGGMALLLLLGLSPSTIAQETEPATTLSCGDCHEQAQTFIRNPHARASVVDGVIPNPVCESCHGDGTAHMEAGGDTTLIQVPRGFSGANETCLSCHDTATDRRSHRTGAHANSKAVNCFSCHKIHNEAHGLLAAPDPALCSSCHSTQAASFRNKPYTHRIGAGLVCSTCHEPHSRAGEESIRRTPAGEKVCLSCHTEKRGPYVFQHAGVAIGDCAACHEPHGSGNPNQLRRSSVAQVCMECHSPITTHNLGSIPPAFHNLNNSRYLNCTTCHVAIHGSNRSPALLK